MVLDGFAGMHGDGWWIVGVVVMVLFWGGLAWMVMSLIRRTDGNADVRASRRRAHISPDEILRRRLASGDIDPEEFSTRMDALNQQTRPASERRVRGAWAKRKSGER